jgi:hypothetical protein
MEIPNNSQGQGRFWMDEYTGRLTGAPSSEQPASSR